MVCVVVPRTERDGHPHRLALSVLPVAPEPGVQTQMDGTGEEEVAGEIEASTPSPYLHR